MVLASSSMAHGASSCLRNHAEALSWPWYAVNQPCKRDTSPSSTRTIPILHPSPPPAPSPTLPGANQQVMVRFAVARGTAESFHRRACFANLAMSLAFAQVPSQAPLLYDSCMTPPMLMASTHVATPLRVSARNCRTKQAATPPLHCRMHIQTIHRRRRSFVANEQGSSAHG